ncbi:MAG: hypothetical protein HQ515_21840, partial [Phycisphaeraceae bacterium]|nr:hypothetical protein [Phycisphaeraceae bacterium]
DTVRIDYTSNESHTDLPFTVQSGDGILTDGSDIFTSTTFVFTEEMKGRLLNIDVIGAYEILEWRDADTVRIDYTSNESHAGLSFTVQASDGILLTNSSDIFTSATFDFTEEMEGELLNIKGIGSFEILKRQDSHTVRIDYLIEEDLTDLTFTVTEQIKSLQEFVDKIIQSGVLSSQPWYNPDTKAIEIPLGFSIDVLANTDIPLDLDFDLANGVIEITSDILADLTVHASGAMTLVIDLDGLTGTEGTSFLLDQVEITSELDFNISVPSIAGKLGFFQFSAGGQGSSLELKAVAKAMLDQDGNTFTTEDRLFLLQDILSGSASSALQFDLYGGLEEGAVFRAALDNVAVEVNGADGSLELVDPDQHVLSVTLYDVFDLTRMDYTLPKFNESPFALSLSDLQGALADAVQAIKDTLLQQPFYTETIPVIDRSLEEIFDFVTDLSDKLEAFISDPSLILEEVEAFIEDKLGISDSNDLDPEFQKIALWFEGAELRMHIQWDAFYSDMFAFSLSLDSFSDDLAALAGTEDLTDIYGNQIALAAYGEVVLDVGIDFSESLTEVPFVLSEDAVHFKTGSSRIENTAEYSATQGQDVDITGQDEFDALVDDLIEQIENRDITDFSEVTFSAVLHPGISAVGINNGTQNVDSSAYASHSRQLDRNRAENVRSLLEARLGQAFSGINLRFRIGNTIVGENAVRGSPGALEEQNVTIEGASLTMRQPVAVNVYAYDGDNSGTRIEVGLKVYGSELTFELPLGPVSLGVTGGYVNIDGDGVLATNPEGMDGQIEFNPNDHTDYVRFTLGLTQSDQGFLGMDFTPSLHGYFDISLPVTVEAFEYTVSLGEPIRIPGEFVLPDTNSLGIFKLDREELTFPNIGDITESIKDELAQLTNPLAFTLNNASSILNGVDFVLGSVEDVFGSSIAQDLPLVGDSLSGAATFIQEIRVNIIDELRERLDGKNGALAIRDILWESLGPNGMDLIGDTNGDEKISEIDDVVVSLYDENPSEGSDFALIEDWKVEQSVDTKADAIEFKIKLGGTITSTLLDIPLALDIPGFELDIRGGLGVDINWTYDFGFGISLSDGFYLTTNSNADPELEVNLDVHLAGAPFTATGKLLFFRVDVTDTDSDSQKAGFQPSGLKGGLSLDLVGDSHGRLTLNHILSSRASEVFNPAFRVDTLVKLEMVLSVEGAKGLPKIKADFILEWDWSLKNGTEVFDCDLDNFRIDIGSLISDFLQPIAQRIQTTLAPMKPVIDVLSAPIPGLEAILPGDGNLMSLIDTILKMYGRKPIDWSFVEAAKYMLGFVDQVNAMMSYGNGEILLGGLADLGTGNIKPYQASDPWGNLNQELASLFQTITDKSTGGTSQDRGGFEFLPYILDLGNWMKLLQGGDATLFTYEMPLLTASFGNFSQILAVIPLGPIPLTIRIFGGFEMGADLAFGYDSYGITKALRTGNSWDVLDGFYASDWDGSGQDKAEFYFRASFGLEASASIAIVRGGLRGSLNLDVDIDLMDVIHDGKIRPSEIQAMWDYEGGGIANLVNLDARFYALVTAFVDIRWITFKKFKIRLTWKRIVNLELANITLLQLKYNAQQVTPKLATQDGNVLRLNAGPYASDRDYETEDVGEIFLLSGSGGPGGTVTVKHGDITQTFEAGVSGFNSVVAWGGLGDDVLDASQLSGVPVEFHGGVGNDVLIAGSGGGELHGDVGDDTLTGGSGNDSLYGGPDNDLLLGRAGNDFFRGNGGDDHIEGNLGDDTIYGGGGEDKILGQDGNDEIHGGDGDDHLEGNQGDDIIFGDLGTDTLYGHTGKDILIGDEGSFDPDADFVTAIATGSTDYIYGLEGDDIIAGGGGADILIGDSKDNGVTSTDPGKDVILGDGGTIQRSSLEVDGSDTGASGDNDWIEGNQGDDTIYGGNGDDKIFGQDGSDVIHGDSGDDHLEGNQGDDIVFGDLGTDHIYGHTGEDILIGDEGSLDADADSVTAIAIGSTDYIYGLEGD